MDSRGRPATKTISDEEVEWVLAEYKSDGSGVGRVTILSDNGSCFVGVRQDSIPKGTWTPTVFENELLNMYIHLINSRPYHPQTNGKLERFHRTLETEISRHDSLDDFITYYNERRLHWSLDIDNRQTPSRLSTTSRYANP